METKIFHGIEISRLGFGAMRLPETDGRIDRRLAQDMFDRAIDSGVNYLDTAVIYHSGDSEVFLGEILGRYNREKINLASKYTISESSDYRTMFEQQLKRLKTDYLDFYLMHGIGDATASKYINDGAVDYFLEQQKKGRIKFLGFSTHASVETLGKFVSHHQWDFAQMQLNYYDWIYSHTQQEYELLKEHNIPIVVMEPVRGGRLATLSPAAIPSLHKAHPEWSLASWAFRFVRSLPQVQVILSGMTTMEQVEDNLMTFSEANGFTDTDKEILFNAARAFHDQVHVPCTSCRYCCDPCPTGINIPEWLSLYNRSKVDGEWVVKRFKDRIDSQGSPVDCISCGKCSKRCPQGIDIPACIQSLSELLQK